MAQEDKNWYVRSADGGVYGPASRASLVAWAKEGRISPSSCVSHDAKNWIPAETLADLEMDWVVEVAPGRLFGPYNRDALVGLKKRGAIPENAVFYRKHTKSIEKSEIKEVLEPEIVDSEPMKSPADYRGLSPVEGSRGLSPGGIFKGVDRDRLMALEAAARRELAAAKASGAILTVPNGF